MPLCKSFPCHSYEDPQDGGVTFAPVSASVSSCFGGKPSATPHKSQLYARPVFVAATALQSLLPRAQSASTLNLSVRRRRARHADPNGPRKHEGPPLAGHHHCPDFHQLGDVLPHALAPRVA